MVELTTIYLPKSIKMKERENCQQILYHFVLFLIE